MAFFILQHGLPELFDVPVRTQKPSQEMLQSILDEGMFWHASLLQSLIKHGDRPGLHIGDSHLGPPWWRCTTTPSCRRTCACSRSRPGRGGAPPRRRACPSQRPPTPPTARRPPHSSPKAAR